METDFFKPAKPKLASIAEREGGRLTPLVRPSGKSGYNAKSLSACSTAEARRVLDFEHALKLRALPLGIIKLFDQNLITFAVPSDCSADTQSALKFAAGCKVKLLAVGNEILDDAIFQAYHGDEQMLQSKLTRLHAAEPLPNPLNGGFALEFRPRRGETATFLAALVDYAISRGASDIHLVPAETGSCVKLRIDGNLLEHQGPICSLPLHQQLITRIKVLSSLDVTRKSAPQDGSFQVPISNRQVNVRVSIMPTIHGEKAVLRLLGCEGLLTLSSLGFDQKIFAFIKAFLQRSEGATLLAGPTGSGKTTTMYAFLQELREKNLSLVTIEDPVEIHLEGAAQTGLSEKTGLTYAACLRSVLRQDPDVILLGEIRDEESAKIAVQAALSGHLLLSTVHARNVPEIFLRLKSLDIDPLSIAQAVNLLICQHLLPRLCPSCKVIHLSNTNQFGFEVFQPVGCARCGYSGYQSRVLAAEALWLDSRLSRALANGQVPYHEILKHTHGEYHAPLHGSLQELLKKGEISLEQMLSLCEL